MKKGGQEVNETGEQIKGVREKERKVKQTITSQISAVTPDSTQRANERTDGRTGRAGRCSTTHTEWPR